MEKEKDKTLFGGTLDDFTLWKQEWKDMPEYKQNELKPFKEVIVRFETQEDVDAFAKLVNQKITTQTKFLWYPEITIERYSDKRYVDESTLPDIRNK